MLVARTTTHTNKALHNHRSCDAHIRICQRCESGNVDDEIHALLHCTMFSVERENFLHEVIKVETNFQSLSDNCKLETILSKAPIVNLTAHFILQCKF